MRRSVHDCLYVQQKIKVARHEKDSDELRGRRTYTQTGWFARMTTTDRTETSCNRGEVKRKNGKYFMANQS